MGRIVGVRAWAIASLVGMASVPMLFVAGTALAHRPDDGRQPFAARTASTLAAGQAPSRSPQTNLTLADAIARALERTLDIAGEPLNPQAVEIARINRDIADIDLRETMATTVSLVQNAYLDLVYATEAVALRQQALERAETLARDNEARVEAGTMTSVDTLPARTEVAARLLSLAEAEQHRATTELALKRLIVDGTDSGDWGAMLNPVTAVKLVDRPSPDPQPDGAAGATPRRSPRIEAATAAHELAGQHLAAEQRKFDEGAQTTFFVIQAQRDLAVARAAELRAILDHQKALVEFERAQQTSLPNADVSTVR